jgi:lipoprotein-releasing system permease protein
MLRPLALAIGLRYLGAKRRNHFISFITGISMLGIALGVTVLVTVMSIMNGFDEVIRGKIFDIAQHITVQDMRRDAAQGDWADLRKRILKEPQVLGVAPFLASQGLLAKSEASYPVAVYGVVPSIETSVSSLPEKMVQGKFNLQAAQQGIILGEQIASALELHVGDPVTLYIPVLNKTLLGMAPRSQTVTVVGIFRTGKGLGLDNALAYMHLADLQALYQSNTIITGLRIKTDHLYKAPQLADQLSDSLPSYYLVSDWTARYGNLMKAIALEKTMTTWILFLLIAIAAFNLVSSLIMIVTEKQGEIAILRTLGMPTHTILGIFIVQGSCIGLGGTLLGLGSGFLLSQHITYLAQVIEQWFHLQLFAGNAFIHDLPSKIQTLDFIKVGLTAMGISLVATIYPAFRAAQTAPVEALRYE